MPIENPSDILSMPTENPSDFVIDQEKLMENLTEFHVDEVKGHAIAKTFEFIHLFFCKIIGPRGSGKTSFMVSTLKKLHA